jgi:hypothetical protein
MITTRVGKIGRLPKDIRDELGRRIEDGVPGKDIVMWLNGLPDVLAVLKELFEGRLISEQNLSDWKQTGHAEWVRLQEAHLLAVQLAEHADELNEAVPELSDRLACALAAELARLALVLTEQENDPDKRWKRLCEANRELSRLRRDDDRVKRTGIREELWNRQVEREEVAELERMKKEAKERLRDQVFAPIHNATMAKVFGGGKYGERMAELLHRIKFDLPLEDMLASVEKAGPVSAVAPNPGESGLIQANKGEGEGTEHRTTTGLRSEATTRQEGETLNPEHRTSNIERPTSNGEPSPRPSPVRRARENRRQSDSETGLAVDSKSGGIVGQSAGDTESEGQSSKSETSNGKHTNPNE